MSSWLGHTPFRLIRTTRNGNYVNYLKKFQTFHSSFDLGTFCEWEFRASSHCRLTVIILEKCSILCLRFTLYFSIMAQHIDPCGHGNAQHIGSCDHGTDSCCADHVVTQTIWTKLVISAVSRSIVDL